MYHCFAASCGELLNFYEVNVSLKQIKKFIFTGNVHIWLLIYNIGKYIYEFLPLIFISFAAYYIYKYRNKLTIYNKTILLFFLSWGTLTLLKLFTRSGAGNAAQAVTPMFVFILFILQQSYTMKTLKGKYKIKFPTKLIIGIILLRLITIPLFVTDSIFSLISNHYSVVTKYGEVIYLNNKRADETNRLIKEINSHSSAGDYIFVTPWFAPPLYALTNRKNPTYYDSLIDVVARPSQLKQEQICKDLIIKKTKLIIHSNKWDIDGNKMYSLRENGKRIDQCIQNDFQYTKNIGRYSIFIPRNS